MFPTATLRHNHAFSLAAKDADAMVKQGFPATSLVTCTPTARVADLLPAGLDAFAHPFGIL
jgi:hypothetical protein